MKLYTPVGFPVFKERISYQSKIVFLGSCFAENLGGWLADRKFSVSINPFGISYNPMSMAQQIRRANLGTAHDLRLIAKLDGQMVHFDAHSSVNSGSAEGIMDELNLRSKKLKVTLAEADFLFLTFGTSFAFRHIESSEIVNNCHRQPARLFNRELLDVEQMSENWKTTLKELIAINPKIQIVLTVSPVRHLRHGAIDNQRSKARLLLLSEYLEKEFEQVTYLPIYEMVMDELRDYRFYSTQDLIHLNDLGLSLITDRFCDSLIAEKEIGLLSDVEDWLRMSAHRIDNSNSEASRTFLAQLAAKTLKLKALLPDRF